MSHDRGAGMQPLLDAIVGEIPPPCDQAVCDNEPFTFSVNNISTDPYLGRLVTGKVHSGRVVPGSKIKLLSRSGEVKSASAAVSSIFVMRGTERVPTESAQAGDIVVLAGVDDAGVADSIVDPSVEEPLPTIPVCAVFGWVCESIDR
jgi:GTP-binding protein